MKSDLILKEVESILEKNKSNTLPLNEYKEKLTREHKDLSEAAVSLGMALGSSLLRCLAYSFY